MPNGDWKDKFKWLRGLRARPLWEAPPREPEPPYEPHFKGFWGEVERDIAEWFPAFYTTPAQALEYATYPFFTAPGMAAWEAEERLRRIQEEPLEYPEPMPPVPARAKLPRGEIYEEYGELPLTQQMLYELPAYAALGLVGIPGAKRPPRVKAPKVEAPVKAAKAEEFPKLTEFVKKLKPIQAEYEATKHKVKQKQAAKIIGAFGKYKGEEFHKYGAIARKGKIPPPEAPSEITFSLEEKQLLKEVIQESPKLPPITVDAHVRLNMMDALDALLLEGRVPTGGMLENFEKVFGKAFARAVMARRSFGAKAWNIFMDALNIPRTVMASWDISMTYRQGALILTKHPERIPSTIKHQLRMILRDKWSKELHEATHITKREALMTEHGLYRPDWWAEVTPMAARPEAFMGRYALRVPGVTRSGRAYTVGLNKIRTDEFNYLCDQAEKMGLRLQPNDYRALCEAINNWTGRGSVPHMMGDIIPAAGESTFMRGGLGAILNNIFFSPRLQLSRIATPMTLLSESPYVRKVAARTLAQFFGFWTTVMGTLYWAGQTGYEVAGKKVSVEFDPRSTDFGKIRIGDTRWDVLAGFQPWMRFMAQLLTGERRTITGRIQPVQRWELINRFRMTKRAPGMGMIEDFLKGTSGLSYGETFLGEPIEELDDIANEVLKNFAPLFVQDVLDALEEEGWVGGIMALPGAVGVGIQTYDSVDPTVSGVYGDISYYQELQQKAKRMLEKGKVHEIRKLVNEHPDANWMIDTREKTIYSDTFRLLNRVGRQLTEWRKEREKWEDADVPDEEKDAAIDQINRQMLELAIKAGLALDERRAKAPKPIKQPSMIQIK